MSECFYKYSVLKRLANFSSIAQFFKSALWPSTLCVCVCVTSPLLAAVERFSTPFPAGMIAVFVLPGDCLIKTRDEEDAMRASWMSTDALLFQDRERQIEIHLHMSRLFNTFTGLNQSDEHTWCANQPVIIGILKLKMAFAFLEA